MIKLTLTFTRDCCCPFCYSLRVLACRLAEVHDAPALLSRREDLQRVMAPIFDGISNGERCVHFACENGAGHRCGQ